MFLNFAIPIQFLKINLPKFSVQNSPILRKSSGLKGPDSDFTLYFSHSCNTILFSKCPDIIKL